jgi:transposase
MTHAKDVAQVNPLIFRGFKLRRVERESGGVRDAELLRRTRSENRMGIDICRSQLVGEAVAR